MRLLWEIIRRVWKQKNPFRLAAVLKDNAQSWKIVWKMNSWPTGEAWRKTMKFWGQSFCRGHYPRHTSQPFMTFIICSPPPALLHLVLLSGLEAIRKMLGVGEISHFYKPSYCCVSWLVCIYVLFKIPSLITRRTITSGSHWIKLTTWLKSDDGYQSISAVWIEIRRLLLFHGLNKGQETNAENKRMRFTETSDGETKCWLTIKHKEARKNP